MKYILKMLDQLLYEDDRRKRCCVHAWVWSIPDERKIRDISTSSLLYVI